AAYEQRAGKAAGWRKPGFALELIGNSHLVDLLGDINAAGATRGRIGIADTLRSQKALLERFRRRDVRFWRAGLYSDGENRLSNHRLGAWHDLALLEQAFDITLDQDQRVRLLA